VSATKRAGLGSPRDQGRDSRPLDPWLVFILFLATALRLAGLDSAPPGINQDEALSAWNGWCLLKTGHALSGEPWPIFHCRNIGDYPTMLFFYVLMPFQALSGLSVWSTRLPAALAGIAAAWCAWDIGRRLAGDAAGRWAALALAVAPWSVFLGHFGTGASLGPLQALLPLVLVARTGLIPALGPAAGRGRFGWALASGLAFGVGAYGFHSLRVQLPLTLAALWLVAPREAVRVLSNPGSRPTMMALGVGFLAPFLPLAYVTLADPDSLRRWQMTRLWQAGAPWNVVAALVADRWVMHFAPDFLFVHGDRYSMLNPARMGALAWWMLPGMLAGALVMASRAPRDARARLVLALLLLYPVGDLFSANDGVHSLRSAAGLPALAITIGVGIDVVLRWAGNGGRAVWSGALALLLAAVTAEGVQLCTRFFHDAVRNRTTQIEYQVALLEAARWLGPRLGPNDQVFCTTTGMNEPFVILLVGLRYDARMWLIDPKDRVDDEYDRYRRFGRFHFVMDQQSLLDLDALRQNARTDTVYFISRPQEFGTATTKQILRAPGGEAMLWVYSTVL
jgi:4-amino-4-deoxy-L-arabinose transferase-like glycosyltransferase